MAAEQKLVHVLNTTTFSDKFPQENLNGLETNQHCTVAETEENVVRDFSQMNEDRQPSKTPSLIIREDVLDSELTAEEGIGNERNDASKFDMGDDELMDKCQMSQ